MIVWEQKKSWKRVEIDFQIFLGLLTPKPAENFFQIKIAALVLKTSMGVGDL